MKKHVFERRTSAGSWLFALFGRETLEILGQIVSLRVRTLCNTNLVASRHIKRQKGLLRVSVLPVYVPRRSKSRSLSSLLADAANVTTTITERDLERLCHGYLVHLVYNANYVSFFDMKLGKLQNEWQNQSFVSNNCLLSIVSNVTNNKKEIWKTVRLTVI